MVDSTALTMMKLIVGIHGLGILGAGLGISGAGLGILGAQKVFCSSSQLSLSPRKGASRLAKSKVQIKAITLSRLHGVAVRVCG